MRVRESDRSETEDVHRRGEGDEVNLEGKGRVTVKGR